MIGQRYRFDPNEVLAYAKTKGSVPMAFNLSMLNVKSLEDAKNRVAKLTETLSSRGRKAADVNAVFGSVVESLSKLCSRPAEEIGAQLVLLCRAWSDDSIVDGAGRKLRTGGTCSALGIAELGKVKTAAKEINKLRQHRVKILAMVPVPATKATGK